MVVTDIYGNKLKRTDNISFVLVSGKNLLIHVGDDIYKYNMTKIQQQLKGFLPAGYVKGRHDTMLMVNKKIAKQPDDYMFVGTYKGGNLWMPYSYDNFVSFSTIYTKGKTKPKNIFVGLVRAKPHIDLNSLGFMEPNYNLFKGSKGKVVMLSHSDNPWFSDVEAFNSESEKEDNNYLYLILIALIIIMIIKYY
jgi:hypothetical protein